MTVVSTHLRCGPCIAIHRLRIITLMMVSALFLPQLAAVPARQDLINALQRAGAAYWDQKVVIQHPDGIYYGYSGTQTVVEPGVQRYYESDSGYIPEPHIFIEQEASSGHAGVGIAYVRAYEMTKNKFFLRVAKSLGDTLLSAQRDNGSGGWWYDMGVIGWDRLTGSPTFRQTRDFGRWVNYFPWGGHGNVQDDHQGLGTFDGTSQLAGYFLLRLSQACPADDVDRIKYLAGAKRLADMIVALGSVTDLDKGYRPYGSGGVPQHFPYDLMKHRTGIDAIAGYPYELPHNLMVTLNDGAMTNAIYFLIEFWKLTGKDDAIDHDKYLSAIRLNVDYLMDVFDLSAGPNGRGGFASQYWVDDGSSRAKKPTWGRAMEPPAFDVFGSPGEDALLKWWTEEIDTVRKSRIEQTILRLLLYYKLDAKPVNSDPTWVDQLNNSQPPCPYWYASTMNKYDPAKPVTWWWWLWYNHDASAGPLNTLVSSSVYISESNPTAYVRYFGADALVYGHYNKQAYPMLRDNMGWKIYLSLGGSESTPAVRLLTGDTKNDTWIRERYGLDTHNRFFGTRGEGASAATTALAELDTTSGFFLPKTALIAGHTYKTVSDVFFSTRMVCLANSLGSISGTVVDSDGDGVIDSTEVARGSDPLDSGSTPSKPLSPQGFKVRIER